MPSVVSWARNSSLGSWLVGEIEYPGFYVEEVPLCVVSQPDRDRRRR